MFIVDREFSYSIVYLEELGMKSVMLTVTKGEIKNLTQNVKQVDS